MKKLLSILFTVILAACNSGSKTDSVTTSGVKSFSEDIEWSNMWMVSVNSHDLPKVLIIGDSHVERYYPVIAEKLSGKAYCSRFTTSRSMGDPALKEQLKTLFFSYKFDIISFNNGLHGVDYSDEAYGNDIPLVYNIFHDNNPGLKLIWVNTTARRVRDSIPSFDQYNQGVINRNKAVKQFTSDHNIPLIDFYSLSVSHPEFYESDGIHFNKAGVEEEARSISEEILNVIENK